MYPFKLHSNDFPARRPLSFAPRISHFRWNFKGGNSSGGATKDDIDKVDSITIGDFEIISTNLTQIDSAPFYFICTI